MSESLERYRVQRHREATFLARAIELAGGRLLTEIDPTQAPFELRVMSPAGEILDLICYPFLANKYRQKGRPTDEHRFQVKYGSDFKRYHQIYIDSTGARVTLMFGVHLEEEVLVAVDPVMHNPTWFSRSVEFKDRHVAEIQRTGWLTWQRERSTARRKRHLPLESWNVEMLLGLTPQSFFRYVELERLASGLDPGIRALLAERLPAPSKLRGPQHPLEREFGLSSWRLLDVVDGRFRLKVAVRGGVAETHLLRLIEAVPGVDEAVQLDRDGMPDLSVVYKGRRPILIECKNVLRASARGRVKVDFQKTRAAKGDPCSRYYRPDDFQILAACLFPVSESWSFNFCETRALPAHKTCRGHLSQNVYVEGGHWTDSAAAILDEVTQATT